MSKKIRDLTGQQFGRLTALHPTGEIRSHKAIWLCRCSCGNTHEVTGVSLTRGSTRSCGCILKDRFSVSAQRRKDMRIYPEYREWRKAVYVRDNFTCQKCGKRGVTLNAHHIESYAKNPVIRTRISNGITLCGKCHKDYHHCYGNYGGRKEFNKWMNS